MSGPRHAWLPSPSAMLLDPEFPTLRDLLEARAAEYGPRPFATLPDARLTYAETDELANRVAAVLAELGYGAGDIVMVRARNGWAMVATWFACNKLGAVFLPLNALLTGEPLRQVMDHSRSPVLVVDHELLGDVESVRAGVPALRDVLVVGGPPRSHGLARLDDLVERASSSTPPPLPDRPSAPTKLMYTSGTTGVPKGVVWSRHCEALWGRCYGDELIPVAPGEMIYTCLPLFHITCQGTVLAALQRGGQITVDNGFDLLSFWGRVRSSGAVAFSYVGTILSALARRRPRPSDRDNPVRLVLGAAAPIDRWRDIEERFGLQIVETWGQTETASCWSWPARGLPQRPGTVGVPSDRWEARIVSDPDSGNDVGPGRAGELWVKPRAERVLFDGYLGEDGVDAPTRESWTDDGWYRTGDLLSWSDDGELQFVGRERDAIRRAGEMIAPSFVEEAAQEHAQVAEAAAVGVPAEAGVDDEILLCVVGVDGAGVDVGSVSDYLAERLPPFLVPRWLRVHDELPKTPTSRVRKFELRQLGTAGAWDVRRRRWTSD